MKTVNVLCALAISLSAKEADGQFQGKVYVEDSLVKITGTPQPKTIAWCGGFNNPQFSVADLDHDGLDDLVIFQGDQGSIKPFINKGAPLHPDYRYAPQYAANFPNVSSYMILKDFNGDGIKDMFQWGNIGIVVYHGYYNSSNELSFKYYKGLYYDNDRSATPPINAEVNIGDIPSVVDVDNDGDLDFLAYTGDGYRMYWYQNMQVETGLPKDSIRIRLADKCWGKMLQGSLRTHLLNSSCTAENAALSKVSKITDGGNTPCLIDMDNDGDFDVLDGHRAFSYVVYLENGRFPYGSKDSMVYQDTTWAANGDTVKMALWPALFNVDIDQDGVKDMVVTPNAFIGSENYKCIRYYRNTGTDKLPDFKYQSDSLLVANTIDVGTNSYPFLYDYNRDGQPDLFVGSKGYFEEGTGQYIARIMYLQNTSTVGNPSFSLITDDFLGLSVRRYKGISIGIGDIDADGRDDLLMGHTDGTIDFIKNTAANAVLQPQWTTAPKSVLDASGTPVSTNSYSVPLVYDMNKDGKNDLLAGDAVGSLFYFQDMSLTPGTTELTFTNDQLGLVKSDPERTSSGNSTPFIGKIDNTGQEFLLMGSRTGRIFRFTGFQTGSTTIRYPRLDSAYSYILPDAAQGTSYMSAPAVADIDGDGNYDMIVGNVYGGLLLYRQDKTVTIREDVLPQTGKSLLVYPNPAGNDLFLALQQEMVKPDATVLIYNNLGQVVLRQQHFADLQNIRLDISRLPASVYWCVLKTGESTYSNAFVKQN